MDFCIKLKGFAWIWRLCSKMASDNAWGSVCFSFTFSKGCVRVADPKKEQGATKGILFENSQSLGEKD
jgi:hypothetical protein